mgnify:CR=1 FL=1
MKPLLQFRLGQPIIGGYRELCPHLLDVDKKAAEVALAREASNEFQLIAKDESHDLARAANHLASRSLKIGLPGLRNRNSFRVSQYLFPELTDRQD